jgi:hypothetical protein
MARLSITPNKISLVTNHLAIGKAHAEFRHGLFVLKEKSA